MTTIYEILNLEEEKVKELNELRVELVEEKRLRDLDEAKLYFTLDFKALGATTDKLRNAAVKQKLNDFPSSYSQKKARFENIEEELKNLRNVIRVMLEFGEETIEFKRDKIETGGSSSS